jgi:hypothetical protein
LKLRDTIRKWWEGEFIPPANPPGAQVVLLSGRQKRHWTSSACHWLAIFWREHWTMPNYSFVLIDADGDGRRLRLAVDNGEFLSLCDEDVTVSKSDLQDGEFVIGPYSAEELLAAIKPR